MERTIAVVGAGTMGTGIAETAAQAGYNVLLFDTRPDTLGKAARRISVSMERLVKIGTLAPTEAATVSSRVKPLADLVAAAGAHLVIEAIYEDIVKKREIWKTLDSICRPEAIFATCTSSLSITQLASGVSHPERFIGMHFFNPVPQMKLVEIVRGHRTSDATCAAVMELARKLGKTPVEVRDYPGFVSNRILIPMLNEAIFTVFEGVAKPDAVDEIFRLGMNHPMGPLELADLIGLDVCLSILEVLQRDLGDPKYRPCPLLRQMVAAGKLGRKSGEGFYTYVIPRPSVTAQIPKEPGK